MAFFERFGFPSMARAREAAAPIQALKPERRLAGGMTLAELNQKLTTIHRKHFLAGAERPQAPTNPVSGLET